MKHLNCLIDLHLHLDGSISPASARKLAKLQKIEIPDGEEELRRILSVSPDCRDLNEYLEKFDFPLSLLQSGEAISRAVSTLMEELKMQGLIYAEIRFAPQKHTGRGLSQREAIEAACAGLARSPIYGGLILCCMRGEDTKEANMETVRIAKEYLGKGVAGVDLAGAEGLYPTHAFKDIFLFAKEMGVPFTIHAGEAAGPESIYAALEFGATRIGHGVRATEDKRLLKILAEKRIVLECCPTSNLQTQVFSGIGEYPIRAFMDAGVLFTVNTDNLSVSSTNLSREWKLLTDTFSLTPAEIRNILLTSAEASFAEEKQKSILKEEINRCFFHK